VAEHLKSTNYRRHGILPRLQRVLAASRLGHWLGP
jgi:hypothetical protein